MGKLTTDSPLSRRIVLSFLDFLDSVEPAPGVDLEGLEVAKECLAEVFKIDTSSVNSQSMPDSLVDIFSLREATELHEIKSDISHDYEGFSADASCTSSIQNAADASCTSSIQNAADVGFAEASESLGEDWIRDADIQGIHKDELFGQFFGALEKVHYFKTMLDGHDDQVQLDRATQLFHNALAEMQKTGCQTFDRINLAETLKSQGNKAMQSKLYSDAIELYTIAIALHEDNAVYYCNRAAAYTQIHQYTEAIRDCFKSIDINPNYSKAYSRLGFAYYAQGKYRDAIDKGFLKALQLDPNSASIKENIRVAEQKLKEEQQRAETDQNSRSASTSHAAPPPFTSMPFGSNGLPADIASMFMNMAANAYQGQHAPEVPGADSNTDTSNEQGIRLGGNINVNVGEQMPEELTGTLRSVMEMFSGAVPHGSPQDNMSGRSPPS